MAEIEYKKDIGMDNSMNLSKTDNFHRKNLPSDTPTMKKSGGV